MPHPYDALYLADAKRCLADALDYAVNDCSMDIDWFGVLLVQSGYASLLEQGNPAVVSGMSGVELASEVLVMTGARSELPEPRYSDGASPQWWVGWSLAEWQWESGRRYADIFAAVPLSEMVELYPLFHEMDVSRFCMELEARMGASRPSRLSALRRAAGLTQAELAQASGTGLRSIQMYEQGLNDINRAQAITLWRIARAIGCTMEDLLEDPR